jgi:PLP dependent protein
MSVRQNLTSILKELPVTCRLIAVTKTQTIEKILDAYGNGHRVFGENKVQELVTKFEALPKDIEWHLIGHLQTNKVKYIAGFVSLIHSVDSLKLLEEINKQGKKANRVIPCLLQIHIAAEETKFGLSEAELHEILSAPALATFENIRIIGLMGMATFTDDLTVVRKEFRHLRQLFDKIKNQSLPPNVELKELSIGMSGDYKIAIEEGSTLVRVGTAIFGERNYQT